MVHLATLRVSDIPFRTDDPLRALRLGSSTSGMDLTPDGDAIIARSPNGKLGRIDVVTGTESEFTSATTQFAFSGAEVRRDVSGKNMYLCALAGVPFAGFMRFTASGQDLVPGPLLDSTSGLFDVVFDDVGKRMIASSETGLLVVDQDRIAVNGGTPAVGRSVAIAMSPDRRFLLCSGEGTGFFNENVFLLDPTTLEIIDQVKFSDGPDAPTQEVSRHCLAIERTSRRAYAVVRTFLAGDRVVVITLPTLPPLVKTAN